MNARNGRKTKSLSQQQVDNPSSTNNEKETFQKSVLQGTLSEMEYQIKLLLFTMIRGLNNDYNFRLAMKRVKAGKFDNVEFHYDVNGQWMLRLLQVKFRLDKFDKITSEHLKRKSAFGLKKYFASYRQIKQYLKPSETLHDLIIFTNQQLDENLLDDLDRQTETDDILDVADQSQRFKFKSDFSFKQDLVKNFRDTSDLVVLTNELVDCIKNDKYLNMQKPIILKYHIPLARTLVDVKGKKLKFDESNEEIPKYLYDNLKEFQEKTIKVPKKFGTATRRQAEQDQLPNDSISDEEIDDFLSKLIFAVNQPNENEMFRIIENNLKEDNITNSSVKKNVTTRVYIQLFAWIKEKLGTYLTHEDCAKMFKEVKQQISRIKLQSLENLVYHQLSGYGIEFENKLTILHNFLESKENQILFLVNPHNSLFSAIKVYHTLRSLDGYEMYDGCIFLRHELMRSPDLVLSAFESTKSCHLLVIEFSTESDVMPADTFQRFVDILRGNVNKKIAFIVTKEDQVHRTDFQFVRFKDDKNKFMDLTMESQLKIYAKTQFVFQGYSVTMVKLINSTLKHHINEKTLLKMMKNEVIRIGGKLLELGEIQNYHVERELREIVVSFPFDKWTSIFHSTCTGCLDDEKLLPDQDIVLRCNDEKEFLILCKKYETKNIHWFTEERPNDYTWRKSHGKTMEKLRKTAYVQVKAQLEVKRKVVLISTPPRDGKSTELTYLANSLKQSDPYLWVLRVNLVQFSTKLNEQTHFNLKITGKFLREFFWPKPDSQDEEITTLEKELFDSHYEAGKVVLCLDGFDEICPIYKKKVIDFLKVLKDSKIQRLYVTTRPYGYTSELEDELLTFSYTFEPLTRKEQLKIMTGIVVQHNSKLPDDVINREAYKLIDYFQQKGIDFNSPLLLEVVAKAFENSFNSATNSIHINEQKLNLAVFFENVFAHLFHQVYIREKSSGLYRSKDRPGTEQIIDALHKEAIEYHKHIALYVLFGNVDNLKLMFSKDDQILHSEADQITIGKYNLGIIEHIIDGQPKFVHKTFAAYFCALWLVDEQNWRKAGFRNFCRNHVVHQAIVMQCFGFLMLRNSTYADTYPVHYAIFQNSETNLGNLLEKMQKEEKKYGEKINEKDLVMKCSPLKYAVKLNYLNLVEILIKHGVDRKKLRKYQLQLDEKQQV